MNKQKAKWQKAKSEIQFLFRLSPFASRFRLLTFRLSPFASRFRLLTFRLSPFAFRLSLFASRF